MHLALAKCADEASDIRRVARNGEIPIRAPLIGPAMPQADRNRVILCAKSRHLSGKGTLIPQRAMHHHHGRATARFSIGNRIAINGERRH